MKRHQETWSCPKCSRSQTITVTNSAAVEIAHRCTMNKNRMTSFTLSTDIDAGATDV